MKKVVAPLAVLVVAAPLFASAQTTRPMDQPVRDTRDTKAPAWKHAGVHETKDIIGTRIKNTAGKDLGEVDPLLIDRNGKVSHVVIGLGGLAGVGEKKVVVPWSDLKFAPVAAGKKNAIMMDEARLENAPRYDRDAPAASPRTDSDRDGKPNRTDRAPLDPTKKERQHPVSMTHPAGNPSGAPLTGARTTAAGAARMTAAGVKEGAWTPPSARSSPISSTRCARLPARSSTCTSRSARYARSLSARAPSARPS